MRLKPRSTALDFLSLKGERNTAMALDVGGKMFEAMEHLNKTALTEEEFVKIVKDWYLAHSGHFDAKMDNGTR